MNCCTENQLENYKNYKTSIGSENARLLIGLALAFTGLYVALFSGIYGHALGFLLLFGSPFVILTDEK